MYYVYAIYSELLARKGLRYNYTNPKFECGLGNRILKSFFFFRNKDASANRVGGATVIDREH